MGRREMWFGPAPEWRALDPVIRELFAKLPEPGSVWPVQERAAWFRAIAGALDFIYGSDGDETTIRITFRNPPSPPQGRDE